MDKICSLPSWLILILGMSLIVAVVVLVFYMVHKKVAVKIGKLSIESEKQIIEMNQDNTVRLKIHSQIREYENYTGLIERIIFDSFEKTYDMNHDEKTIVRLFCQLVRRALEKQLMLDLVANGIVHMTEDELRDYTKNKSQGYENRILNFMSNYNETVLPDKNILEVVKNIDMNQLEGIYFTIYKKCVDIAKRGE